MDPHSLTGAFSVESSAGRIRHYRYVEERMMRVLGGWIALTPELPAKLLLGRHVWDCAQHADLWGRRLPELRSLAQQSEPANDRVVTFMDLLEVPDGYGQTVERLTGLYRVLKPHLVAVYGAHLADTNPVYEPPTRRILQRCLAEERRHVAAGGAVLERLIADPAARTRSDHWEGRLREALVRAGGVTGVSPELAGTVSEDVDPEMLAQDVVAVPSSPIALDDLPALARAVAAHQAALATGDGEAMAGQVSPAARAAVLGEYATLPRPIVGSRVVAVAAIGRYRVVRLALDTPAALAVVQLRWQEQAGAWEIVAAETVRRESRA